MDLTEKVDMAGRGLGGISDRSLQAGEVSRDLGGGGEVSRSWVGAGWELGGSWVGAGWELGGSWVGAGQELGGKARDMGSECGWMGGHLGGGRGVGGPESSQRCVSRILLQ